VQHLINYLNNNKIRSGLPPGIVVTASGSQARDRGFDPRWELQNLYCQINTIEAGQHGKCQGPLNKMKKKRSEAS
jgi:hypothetical protein